MSPPFLDGPSSPLDFYTRRATDSRIDADEAVRVVASYRAGLFVLGLIGCMVFYESLIIRSLPRWTFIPVVAVGLFLAVQAGRVNSKALKFFRLCDYYEVGIARLKRD